MTTLNIKSRFALQEEKHQLTINFFINYSLLVKNETINEEINEIINEEINGQLMIINVPPPGARSATLHYEY